MELEKHYQELEYFLRKMQRSPERLENFQILRGGISGATTYRLQMTDEELVCKIVQAESEAGALERARREILFYQILAPRLPIRVPQVISSIQDAGGIGLLLAAYQPSPAPAQWQKSDYEEVARQLGQLHTIFWEIQKHSPRTSGFADTKNIFRFRKSSKLQPYGNKCKVNSILIFTLRNLCACSPCCHS